MVEKFVLTFWYLMEWRDLFRFLFIRSLCVFRRVHRSIMQWRFPFVRRICVRHVLASLRHRSRYFHLFIIYLRIYYVFASWIY